MTVFLFSHEHIGPNQLVGPTGKLTDVDRTILWRVMQAIEGSWQLSPLVQNLRSQWEDMIESRCREPGSYLAEFKNAVAVLIELETLEPSKFNQLLFFDTIVERSNDAHTRLEHAKFYVINDFIRFLILSGAFQQFGARNYRGFMGGSRFRDTPPARTGDRF